LTNCGLLPTTERIRTPAANVAEPMALKVLLASLGLLARPVGAGRTLAWYAQRRLERPA
jgi:hypothetical protein